VSAPIPSLRSLPLRTLADLGSALGAGRITALASGYQVRHAVPATTEAAADELSGLLRAGLDLGHATLLLQAILAERQSAQSSAAIELVTSGPDAVGSTRDTGVILRDLFARAESRVLIVGFAIHQGRRVFAALADRMAEREELAVRLCVDIARRPGDTSNEDGILARFRTRLVQREWPGPRLPEVFYDPRALVAGGGPRASLHAKCVVVDGRIAFVGSANLTEAAQARNIEMGLLVRSAEVAGGIEHHLDGLIERGFLRRLPLADA
jgi:phosphatidylserine/phosphatidylglycerophosphate/cardiolipin synthase-like enzyme